MQIPLAALRTPSTYTRLLLRRWPAETDALLAGTGLTAAAVSHAPHITAEQQLQVLGNARRLSGRPDWALEFGRQLNIHSHGPLGFAALSAPTLGEGLDVLAQFARIRSPYVNVESLRTDQHLVLKFDTGLYPLESNELPTIEILLQVAMSFADAVLGGSAVDTSLWISQPPPHACGAVHAVTFVRESNSTRRSAASCCPHRSRRCPARCTTRRPTTHRWRDAGRHSMRC